MKVDEQCADEVTVGAQEIRCTRMPGNHKRHLARVIGELFDGTKVTVEIVWGLKR